MHAVVMESLEDYLSGLLEPANQRTIEAHLAECKACREELDGLQSVSQLFVSLRPWEPAQPESQELLTPSPGFYARVMEDVQERQSARSFAGFFGFDFAFGRRLALSSLLTLVLVGGWLVSREAGYSRGPSPDSILAQQNDPSFETAPGPDSMLATLTSYEH